MDLYCPKAVTFCFKYLHDLYPLILKWDSSTQKFYSLGRSSRRSIFWLLMVILVNDFIMGGACIFSLCKYTEIGTVNLLICGFFLSISYFDFLFSWSLFWNAEDVVTAFEKMRTLTVRVRGEDASENSSWKMNVNLLMNILQQLFGTALGLPLVITLLKADPLYTVLEDFGLRNILGNYPLMGIRWTVAQVFMNEATRIYGTFLVLIFYWLEMLTETLRKLRKVSVPTFLQLYLQCFIANQILWRVLSDWIGFLLTTMFYLIVLTGVFSIRFVNQTPFVIYFFNLTVQFCTIVAVYIIFKFLIGVLEKSERLIWEKKVDAGLRHGKRTRKEVNFLRAISYKMGPCFTVRKETKLSYYSSILENTINGVLFK